MDDATILNVLRKGGLDPDAVGRGDQATLEALPRFNALASPHQTEELGVQLAERLRPYACDALLVWENVDDAVLAYVVARVLDVPVVRCFDADGLLDHVGRMPAGARLVAVADLLRRPELVQALQSFAQQQNASLEAVAVLLITGVEATGMDGELEIIGLADPAATTRPRAVP